MLGKVKETTQYFDLAALEIIKRHDPGEIILPGSYHRITQQQPIKPEPPGVFVNRRQAHLLPISRIDSPANVDPGQPFLDQFQVIQGNIETVPDWFHFKNGQDLTYLKAAPGELYDTKKTTDQRSLLPDLAVGDRKRQILAISSQPAAEDRIDQRAVLFNIRGHDHDIFRFE